MSSNPRQSDLKLTGLMGTLRSSQLFGNVPGPDLEEIAGFTRLLQLARGDYLFHEGEPAHGCYLVRSGAINVHRVSAAGKEQVIHVFRAGESFAEAALSSPTGYPANARAILEIEEVNGGLVGGASLLADDFAAIISAA